MRSSSASTTSCTLAISSAGSAPSVMMRARASLNALPDSVLHRIGRLGEPEVVEHRDRFCGRSRRQRLGRVLQAGPHRDVEPVARREVDLALCLVDPEPPHEGLRRVRVGCAGADRRGECAEGHGLRTGVGGELRPWQHTEVICDAGGQELGKRPESRPLHCRQFADERSGAVPLRRCAEEQRVALVQLLQLGERLVHRVGRESELIVLGEVVGACRPQRHAGHHAGAAIVAEEDPLDVSGGERGGCRDQIVERDGGSIPASSSRLLR